MTQTPIAFPRGAIRLIPLLIAVLLVFSATAQAPVRLTGTVLGKDGSPKANIAVDILGATRIFAATDTNGKFSVQLRPGEYIVRIRDGTNRTDFTQVMGNGDVAKQFQLPW